MDKTVSLRKLLDSGLLFELNRSVLHPFGYALALSWKDDSDPDGEPDGVVLYGTNDRDGITFSTDSFIEGEEKLRKFMEAEGNSKISARQMLLGFVHQIDPDQIESARPAAPTPDDVK